MRQLYHSMSGLAFVFILSFVDNPADVYLTLFLLFLTTVVEAARLYIPWINQIFINMFGRLMRSVERHNPTGSLYYLMGALIALLLFPKEIALFSMCVLAVGDPSAYIIGTNLGRLKIGRKSLEGSLAFLMVSVAVGFLLHGLWDNLTATVIIAGAATGAVVELVPLRINDNLTIPVSASAVVYILSVYWGY